VIIGGGGGMSAKRKYVYLDREVGSAISSFLENTATRISTKLYTRSVDLTVYELVQICITVYVRML
jgi:hypothetical protein